MQLPEGRSQRSNIAGQNRPVRDRFQLLNAAVQQFSQRSLAQSFGERVDGRDPVEMDQVFVTLVDNLKLRMVEIDAVSHLFGTTEKNDCLTRR